MGLFSDRMKKSGMFGTPKTPNGSSAVAMENAAQWNQPGGGYDQFKKGDAQREKDLPIGGMVPREPLSGKDRLRKAMMPKKF